MVLHAIKELPDTFGCAAGQADLAGPDIPFAGVDADKRAAGFSAQLLAGMAYRGNGVTGAQFDYSQLGGTFDELVLPDGELLQLGIGTRGVPLPVIKH